MHVFTDEQSSGAILSSAILLYCKTHTRYDTDRAPKVAYASLHRVRHDAGDAELGPGQPLTREAIESALMGLTRDSTQGARFCWTDPGVIAQGPGMVAWYTPSRVRHMSFRSGSLNQAGLAAQPATLWIATLGSLHMFALASDERPTQGSAVFHSPHWNLWKGGQMCEGTAVLPKSLEPKQWEDMFYASHFSHPNDGNNWQTRFRGGAVALWRKLLREGGRKPFPTETLVPTGATVAQIVDAVMSTGVKR